MTPSWTDELVEPAAGLARGREWLRVQRRNSGDWLFLAPDGAAGWYGTDPACRRLVPLSPLDDGRLPGLHEALGPRRRNGARHRLLAWRVGRRAVLASSDGERSWITKVYRRDRSLLERWTLPATNPDTQWRTPAVLRYDAGTRTIRLERVEGRSLNERWLAGEGRPEDGDRIADLLRWIGTTTLPRRFPRYGVGDEVRLLESRLEAFHATLENPSPAAAPLVRRVCAALRSLPDEPARFCHRDLHDKQILLDGAKGSLIDLDLAAAGPPGLDAGNLLAHLRLRALQGARVPWREIALRVAAVAGPERVHVWTASALLRLALIYARRRREPGLLGRLMRSAEQALERTGDWAEPLPSPRRVSADPARAHEDVEVAPCD